MIDIWNFNARVLTLVVESCYTTVLLVHRMKILDG